MYVLSCPNCHTDVHVTPAQAGDRIQCGQCQGDVAIPKLGELRKLPKVDEPAAADPVSTRDGTNRSLGSTIAFVACCLIAGASLLAAGYAGVRWMIIAPTMTTESHLEAIESTFPAAEPASMVKEFQDMEDRSLDLTAPYGYHLVVMEKNRWRNNALIAFGILVAGALGAFVAASTGRKAER